jgi:hypothetical protein
LSRPAAQAEHDPELAAFGRAVRDRPEGRARTTEKIETEIATATAAAPFARDRDREEIEAFGTTPEKYSGESQQHPNKFASRPLMPLTL